LIAQRKLPPEIGAEDLQRESHDVAQNIANVFETGVEQCLLAGEREDGTKAR
jgi:hypothetical protein